LHRGLGGEVIMGNDSETASERRRRAAAEGERRRQEQLEEELREEFELNKDFWATEAFANCFVEILREVNRARRGGCGLLWMMRFFELLHQGAKVNFRTLTQTALRRIKPPDERYWGDERTKKLEQALLDVACAGLALLIENAADDQGAGSRKSQREGKLVIAIRAYMDAYNT
jgi:hypothetical protein